jgi:hypothetical protein
MLLKSDKAGCSIPAPGRGVLTIAKEVTAKYPLPAYRSHQLDFRQNQISQWLTHEQSQLVKIEFQPSWVWSWNESLVGHCYDGVCSAFRYFTVGWRAAGGSDSIMHPRAILCHAKNGKEIYYQFGDELACWGRAHCAHHLFCTAAASIAVHEHRQPNNILNVIKSWRRKLSRCPFQNPSETLSGISTLERGWWSILFYLQCGCNIPWNEHMSLILKIVL